MLFRLLQLPFLALEHVFKTMDENDLFTISLCSDRTRRLVRLLNLKMGDAYVSMEEDTVIISVEQNSNRYFKCVLDEHSLQSPCEMSLMFNETHLPWKKEGFGVREWVEHFMYIYNRPQVHLNFGEGCRSFQVFQNLTCVNLCVWKSKMNADDIKELLKDVIPKWNPRLKTMFIRLERSDEFEVPVLEELGYQETDEEKTYHHIWEFYSLGGWYEAKNPNGTVTSIQFYDDGEYNHFYLMVSD